MGIHCEENKRGVKQNKLDNNKNQEWITINNATPQIIFNVQQCKNNRQPSGEKKQKNYYDH